VFVPGFVSHVELVWEEPHVRHFLDRLASPWVGDADAVLDEVEEFVTGARHAREPDRMLATVMFTDIVD
jgi:hypothetical protein